MFGSNYFGYPYFAQGYAIEALGEEVARALLALSLAAPTFEARLTLTSLLSVAIAAIAQTLRTHGTSAGVILAHQREVYEDIHLTLTARQTVNRATDAIALLTHHVASADLSLATDDEDLGISSPNVTTSLKSATLTIHVRSKKL